VGKEPVFFYQTAAAPWALILEAASTLEAHVSDCCTPYLRNSALPGYANATFALIRQVQDIQRARGVYRTLRSSQPSVRALENALGPNVIPPKEQAAGLTSQALLQHLQTYRFRQATDPRDKIYALLPLVKNTEPFTIYPDYGDSTEEAYLMTAKAIIKASGSLDILAAASILPPSPRNLALPSWCLDWSATSTFYSASVSQLRSLQWYNASPVATPRVCFPADEPWRLDTDGVLVDSIATLSEDYGVYDGDRALWKRLYSWSCLAPHRNMARLCRTVRADVWTREGHHSF